MKSKEGHKIVYSVSVTFSFLLLLLALSAVMTSCSGGKKSYQNLTKPERIYAYWDNQERVFTKDDESYTEIYNVIKKSWDASKGTGGLLNMIQLISLEKESAPDDPSRIIFKYDTPIRWRVTPENELSEAGANTYIFFLNWDINAAVICENEDYENRAFFPEVEIKSDEIMKILNNTR